MLFEDRTRSRDPRPRQESESLFEFCDRLDDPRLVAGRPVVNEWFSRYPEDLRSELARRLKSREDTDHLSALYELGLLAAFQDAGLDVRAVRPTQDLSVDLSVFSGETCVAHVEATTFLGELDDPFFRLMQHVTRLVLVQEPRLRIRVHTVATTNQTPSAHRVASFLVREFQANVGRHQPDDADGPASMDRVQYRCPSTAWEIDLTLMRWHTPEPPRSSIVFSRMVGRTFSDPAPLLRNKIKAKIAQHPTLDAPLIVAVSWHDWFQEPVPSEVLAALCSSRPNSPHLPIAGLLMSTGVHVWTAAEMTVSLWLDEDGLDGPWRSWAFPQVRYSSRTRQITAPLPDSAGDAGPRN